MDVTRILSIAALMAIIAVLALEVWGPAGVLVVDVLLVGGATLYMWQVARKLAHMAATQELQNQLAHGHGIICHLSPWRVVASGRSLGHYQAAPIPAWIITSDGRKGFFKGVCETSLPAPCTSVENPTTGELVVPPGLVYSIPPPPAAPPQA